MKVITNNPLVKEWLENVIDVEYIDCSYREILVAVRDMVHKGTKLLTHPLAGSVKPNETPYRSVIVTKHQGKKMDMESLEIIENSIVTFDKFVQKDIVWVDEVLYDFQTVDAIIIRNAVYSAIQ